MTGIHRVKGIIVHSIRHTDSSRVVKILTSTHGLKTFMIRLGKNKNDIIAMLHPLSVVEFTSHFREQVQIHSISSLSRGLVLQTIPFDLEKTSIAIFVNEILHKSLPDDYANAQLFDFIEAFVLVLDQSNDCRNLHLWFLVNLSRYYGFYPHTEMDSLSYFDLQSGTFTDHEPAHGQFVSGKTCLLWAQLIRAKSDDVTKIEMTKAERHVLLQTLVSYFRIHIEGLREIKSHLVLEEVFNEAR